MGRRMKGQAGNHLIKFDDSQVENLRKVVEGYVNETKESGFDDLQISEDDQESLDFVDEIPEDV